MARCEQTDETKGWMGDSTRSVCNAFVAKSVARDIVDEFWRRISFFCFSFQRRSKLLSISERRVSLLVASCGISTSSRNKFDEKRCWKREESHNNLDKREQEKARRCGPSLSINRANTREHA